MTAFRRDVRHVERFFLVVEAESLGVLGHDARADRAGRGLEGHAARRPAGLRIGGTRPLKSLSP